MASVSFNYVATTTAAGFFGVSSDGMVQGTFMDDPALRNELATGWLATSETLPMWGGVGIFEYIPTDPTTLPMTTPWVAYGSQVGRATTVTQTAAGGLIGFSVFNQGHAMVTSPQSTVPQAGSGMTVPYVRLGSGLRVCVAADPALASLAGSSVGSQVSWDFRNQVLTPYQASGGTGSITSITVDGNGVATATLSGAISGWTISVGDSVNISGATNSGTAPVGLLNTTQIVTAVTSATVFQFQLPTNQGTWGTIGGTIVLNYSGGAINVKLLKIQIGNSMQVKWDPVNQLATWIRNGCCAEILI